MPKERQSTVRYRPGTKNRQQISSSTKTKIEKNKKYSQVSFVVYPLGLLSIASIISYFHFLYIYELFENDKHFSHLSTLERELSFRTEMGLYYSYFKEIAIDSPSFIEGFLSIISDNRTEAPTTINVLERFNLYPEVLLSLIYRTMNSRGMLTELCYQVDRGQTMSPVLSCEGHKEPTYFYVTSVFILNGCLLGLLFLFGTYLSKSILGGIITTLAYLFNHSEATRVMWTPPLRESFSFPFHVLQLFVVTYILQQQQTLTSTNAIKSILEYIKKHDQLIPVDATQNSISHGSKIKLVSLLVVSTILYMLPWQFAQFTLATQLLSLGLLYILNILPFDQFFFILSAQILSLVISAVLMFGNRMLLTSLFSITLFSFYLVCVLDNFFLNSSSSSFQSYRLTLIIIIRRMVLFLFSFIFIKFAIISILFSSVDDDAHIWDILKSKFSSTFRTFDTQLYTCAKEFDFIDMETIIKLCRTGLIPYSIVIICRLVYNFIIDIFRKNKSEHIEIWNSYHIIQTGAYLCMALLIMRLKLFLVPQLCLLISLFMNEQLWPKKMIGSKKWKFLLFIFILIGMSIEGRNNIKKELQIKGEYSNYPMEKMIEWINLNTRNDSIFAGTMPTMANLKLSTHRSIIVHPHYEHKKIRHRVKLVYTMFSRNPLRHIHSILKQYQVNYYVYESHWCTITNRPKGCSFPEMYDIDEQDPRILTRTTLACQTLESHPQPYFKRLFNYEHLSIYEVL
ncbi:unnamed protein product [Rotaria socialis]|uniref:Uncharacterized protein n=2 Tax=Rotaria socialis TaxID=392032 RepID=A0A820T252_9BILA|nr:unnamed protein product [Rotaria socialis]CAF3369951.1 unnamed protein product [Rotaria socialis]CAF3380755.1 unnamed protein product [Rotaria socialis]CAF3452790.1 unnamed protein product [Rotaria socialis]CAF4166174.1 unnamed protein product [Rotaria socialis]